MAELKNYNHFLGRHWETGTVCNFLAYRGVTASHTGKPYSEALLMGVSGGAVMGYFSFAYQGYDPMARILTRNTFDPMNTFLSRLGIIQDVKHTSNSQRAVSNLIQILDSGEPAIVWADMYGLPYNVMQWDEANWAMLPILVYGHDEGTNIVKIADRSRVPLTVSPDELQTARARVKKYKFRTMTVSPPNPEKLNAAVQAGIWDCINLFTEKPPKGSPKNFGFKAFEALAEYLEKPKSRLSWEKEFPAGRKMFAGLTSLFTDINIFGKDGFAERDVCADFLDEASIILDKPGLGAAAAYFRKSAQAWDAFGKALLPDHVPLFKETRERMQRQHEYFMNEGHAAIEKIREDRNRVDAIKAAMDTDFPLSPEEVVAFRENMADHVLTILDVEMKAIAAMKDAMN